MADTVAFFVYGTLKQGECREGCWPAQPVRVAAATMLGELYDLGPYPALLPGSAIVHGQCWIMAADDEAAVLATLDMIEGYSGDPGADLYTRVRRTCQLADGAEVSCWTYHYAQTPIGRQITQEPIQWNGE